MHGFEVAAAVTGVFFVIGFVVGIALVIALSTYRRR
jgi:hypothetical protein